MREFPLSIHLVHRMVTLQKEFSHGPRKPLLHDVIQRLDLRASFFFLDAGERDLERLDREELRPPLPAERDLDRRRPEAELLIGHREKESSGG